MPFRVTTADTLLGEGFAELLATEFTGEGVPRAIDMATLFSAWRRKGGGLRTPLPRDKAIELARELGAGLMSEGTIVGLGRQITVTAGVIKIPDGSPRGSVARVTTPADSLDAALRQTTSRLFANVSGEERAVSTHGASNNPEATRNYITGMSLYRQGRMREAASAFDRAIEADSTYALAIFRRFLAQEWGAPPAISNEAVWNVRLRLTPEQRTALEANLGPKFPAPRSFEQQMADLEQAVQKYADSPEALYYLGDRWFHYGAMLDPANHLNRARDILSRAYAAEPQAELIVHLLDIALRQHDTTSVKRIVAELARSNYRGRWMAGWIGSASVGTLPAFNALRIPVDTVTDFIDVFPLGVIYSASLSSAAAEQLIERLAAANTTSQATSVVRVTAAGFFALRGRPGAALAQWARATGSDAAIRDDQIVAMSNAGGDAGLPIADVIAHPRYQTDATAAAQRRCNDLVWKRLHGAPTTSADAFRGEHWACAWTLDVLDLPHDSSAATIAALAAADSMLRARIPSNDTRFDGYSSVVLAKAWERNGRPDRALRALRIRIFGFGNAESPWSLPDEGRLALVVGDTAGAVRAYQSYLDITAPSEDFLRPRRDSVRAILAKISTP